MIKFEDVKNVTTEEYFNNNQFSIDAFNKKYAAFPGETYPQALKRVCDFVASVEPTKELQKYWSEKWFDEIYNDWWHPAGSIMQGAGSNRKISLANCTTISMGVQDEKKEWDNLESIIKNTGYTLAKTAAYRQGLGIDGSRLRPEGSSIMNSANKSTGVVHWLQWLDNMAYYVGQQGRIPAILLSLNIKHPDIEKFITVKSDYTKIQNANISVQITNDFYKAVENNEDWELYFKIPKIKKGEKIYLDVHSIDMDCKYDEDAKAWYKIATHNKKEEIITKTVKARKLLELIAENMSKNAEPGIQNIDIAREYSNSDAVYDPNDEYDSRILSTNACCVVGETKVMTDKGWLTMEQIYDIMINKKETLLAMSYNIEDKLFELKPILNIFQQRNDITVKLEIEENGVIYKIECSADHPILTKNRGYIEAASLTEDDDIMIYK